MIGPAAGTRIDAADLADALGIHRPTPEQRAIIEAPLGVSLVVAGAGSGKTETMAARVVWLIANGLVAPERVLGLTFTRKAAAELAGRIRTRLRQLADARLADVDPFSQPVVSTYNAFAAGIHREHALRIGREPDADVLGEAAAWQLARSIVTSHPDERLLSLDKSVDQVTQAVLSLSRAMSENEADPDAVAREAAAFADLLPGLPTGSARVKGVYADVREAADQVGALPLIVTLAEAYRDAKRRRGSIEFADQVAFAHRIVRQAPDVVAALTERHGAVILDEYQDTSVGQTALLATAFRGTPVMAVGDPMQSIYGWRGASAANLAGFRDDFGDPDAPVFELSTSWRNPRAVLAAANRIALPLRREQRVEVAPLAPRPDADEGELAVRFEETVADEATALAEWLAGHRDRAAAAGAEPPTMAVLCRTLKGSAVFTTALAAAGLPYRVLGLGGLLERPVVVDLVAALRAVHTADAGPELIRLLAGARFRVGPADLWQLRRVARWLAERDIRQQPLSDVARAGIRASIAAGEDASLVDALDLLVTRPQHPVLENIGEVGRARMTELGELLAGLRQRRTLGVVDTVQATVRALRLDIEAAANETQPTALADLDEFLGHAASYQATDPAATLGGFLGWLAEAERREDLAPRSEPAEPGTVQLLTVHGSKGLEWDVVAVPRLVVDEFPAKLRSSRGWVAFGELPAVFRLDGAEVPQFEWRAADTQKDAVDDLKACKAAVKEHHAAEQRRLAYVAITRARHALLLTGSFWSTQQQWRAPSEYLVELAGAGLLVEPPVTPETVDRADLPVPSTFEAWPADPLGARGDRVRAAADRVAAADPTTPTRWSEEIAALLSERDGVRDHPLELPDRIPASRFKDWLADPAGIAAQLRRPMPQRPIRRTRLGTLFHTWVEERAGRAGVLSVIDDADDLFDEDRQLVALGPDDAERLTRLQATFAASEWGSRVPDAVELEIQLPFAGATMICRIDAVYRIPDAAAPADRSADRWQIVDWKTGAAPTSAAERTERGLQLELYRHAFSAWQGVPVESIDAVLYYVADDVVIRPAGRSTLAALEDRWRDARDSASS